MSVFEQSINIVGNEAIRILDPIAVYNNYRVCHAHLTEDDNYTNNRLEKDAVPTVNLPAPRICALSEQIMDQPSTSAMPPTQSVEMPMIATTPTTGQHLNQVEQIEEQFSRQVSKLILNRLISHISQKLS
nr:unnamed protein product [Callosobruchus analis]